MKRLIAAFLALIMLTSLCVIPAIAADDDFKPIMRFIASSDSHVRNDGDMFCQRIEKMLELGYEASESSADYNNLDALLMAGDLTNDGTKQEFVDYWKAVSSAIKDGTEYMGVVAKNHDGYEMKRKELRSCFTELTGCEADFHKVIKGFHFIGISASDTDGIHYTQKQICWLKKQLDAAVADDPNKPIFVTHHEHNYNTVYGSETYAGWGVSYFKATLNKYPQVVDFSGHSHYPLNDPRSIWQGCFTAIGTGALAYTEMTVKDIRIYDPVDYYEVSTFWIVEVNADGDIRLQGMDLNAGKPIVERIIKNPAEKTNRDFTPKAQKARSTAPVFENKELNISVKNDGFSLSIPAARSTDGEAITLYYVTVKNSLGMIISREWVVPQYYRADASDTIQYEIGSLGEGDYTVSVTAETAYGVGSEPITAKISLEGANTFIRFFRTIKRLFAHVISVIKSIFN